MPPNSRAYASTSVGRVRHRNEDAFLILPESELFVVADGMGGHQRGDVAANLCVDAIRDWYMGKVSEEEQLAIHRMLGGNMKRRLQWEINLLAAVEYSNHRVFEHSLTSPAFRGMGTTLVSLLFHSGQVFIVYSGDSRIYRFRGGRLKQLTVDHSLLNEYLRLKMIEPSEARHFPHRNVIMKAIGLKDQAEIDFLRRRARFGDCYLLCSDGLTDMIEDEEIEIILGLDKSLEDRCDQLVDAAMEAGGVDNITVMLVEYC